MHRRQLPPLALAVLALLVAGCAGPGTDDDLLVEHGLDGLDGRELVAELESSDDARPFAFAASVREDVVLVGDEDAEVEVALPDGESYVSIAPYVESTHDCYYHSLATCQGELADQPVTVTITDDAGEVLVDEATTTEANGFVGFWLPEDVTGTITVEHADGVGSVPFSTADGSPTCITTLQLT